jgi:hypothetical protein
VGFLELFAFREDPIWTFEGPIWIFEGLIWILVGPIWIFPHPHLQVVLRLVFVVPGMKMSGGS